jgi:hypothetical protein
MFRKALLLSTISLVMACSGGSSSSSSGVIPVTSPIATAGGELLTGSGSITVSVRAICTGQVIAGATVWVDDDVNNLAFTDSTGVAVITNVPGIPGNRRINAGMQNFGLSTIVTRASTVNLGLRRSNAGANDFATTSGTITFSGVQPSAEVFFATESSNDVGFVGLNVPNVGGAGNFALTAPINQSHLFTALSRDGNDTISALTLGTVAVGTNTIFFGAVGLDLPDASRPLSPGLVQSIPNGHDIGSVQVGFFSSCFNLQVAAQGFTPIANASTISTFRMPGPNVTALLQTINSQHRVFARTSNSTTSQFTEVFGAYDLTDTVFPLIAMPAGDLTVNIVGSGATPTINLAVTNATVSANSSIYEIQFLDVVTSNRKRQWSFFLPGDVVAFAVPAIPATLIDEGLVTGRSFAVTAKLRGTGAIDFSNLDILATINNNGQLNFGQDLNYTP